MMTKLVNLASRNIVLGAIIRFLCFLAFKLIDLWYILTGFIRTHTSVRSKYLPLKSLKNKYQGERCFIICTGPSLTSEDLQLISNEYSFGMNSICLMKDRTAFRPTFYGCTDLGVYRKLKEEMIDYCRDCKYVFAGDRLARHGSVPNNWIQFPSNIAYHSYKRWFKNDYWCKFSNDCYRVVYNMHSVTHSLIQIAVYLGFAEVYLLGADCSFPKGGKIHFADYGVSDKTIDSARDRNIAGYEEIKRNMDKYGFKVFNATRGGELEVFERKKLEEVLEYKT